MQRDIITTAQHIPGSLNSTADKLSRNFFSNLEWPLNTSVFEQLVELTLVPDIDLFASSLKKKLIDLCHGTQNHSQRRSIYAFSISWSNLKCDAFHPFNLLPQVLRKIREDQALVSLIALVLSTQSWYPLLLQLLSDRSILLPKKDNLLFPSSEQGNPSYESST